MTWRSPYHFRTYDFGPEPEPEPRPRRGWGRLGLALKLLALAALVGGAAWLVQSPLFHVQRVAVQGLAHRTEREVLERVRIVGENILTLPVAEIERTLLQDPWLRRVEVRRGLPDRVTLLIEERSPVAVWEGKGGRHLMDRDGTLLDPAPATSDLPVVKDLDGPPRQVGDRVQTDAAALAARLVAELPAAIGQRARSFEYLSYGGLVVETDKGKRARFGDGSDVEYKLAVWKALLAKGEVERLVVGHVDLRFGDRPFFRDR